MRRRTAGALAALPLAWLLGAAAAAEADEGHDSWWPETEVQQDHSTDGGTEDHSEHGGTVPEPEPDRPLPLVLGVFGGVNGAVVVGAAVIRRRERNVRRARQTARSQRRAVPALGPQDGS